MAISDYFPLVQQFYVAYLGRPADPVGRDAFATQLQAAGAPTELAGLNTAYYQSPAIKSLVDSLGKSTEAAALYGAGDDVSFVTAIYQNMLGRAPRAEGLKFWSDEIAAGRLTRAEAPIKMMAAAFSNTSNPAQAAIDQATVNNKLGVAIHFTDALNTVEEIATYSGSSASALARGMLSVVTAQTDIAKFQESINSVILDMARILPPQTEWQVGTTNDDVLVLGQRTITMGMGGNDTFSLVNLGTTSDLAFPTLGDFAAGDKIAFQDAGGYARSTLGAKVTVDSTMVFKDYLDAATAGSVPGEVRWFTYQRNTYVVNDASASTSYQAGADQIVKLVGTLDLSAGTVSDAGVLTFIGV